MAPKVAPGLGENGFKSASGNNGLVKLDREIACGVGSKSEKMGGAWELEGTRVAVVEVLLGGILGAIGVSVDVFTGVSSESALSLAKGKKFFWKVALSLIFEEGILGFETDFDLGLAGRSASGRRPRENANREEI
ncbi:hypothetical protein EYC84_007891 [Monilinia fructicola]|uniref:Uncharacterized protein n=1 Tax=Monilinia fructicola TaxID=38448 RepID=A0A5M9JHK6_MONFR|nr:hypothetical protein EYC84_007891 [Monilinia fructicola]